MRLFRLLLLPALISPFVATASIAQDFTTSAGVKPILELIRPQWVAIRPFDGKDHLYFTTLLVYRCGIERISFAYNGGEFQPLDHEPCYRGEADPSALKVETHLPYVVAPLEGLQSVDIRLEFDDGSVLAQSYGRAEIQIN